MDKKNGRGERTVKVTANDLPVGKRAGEATKGGAVYTDNGGHPYGRPYPPSPPRTAHALVTGMGDGGGHDGAAALVASVPARRRPAVARPRPSPGSIFLVGINATSLSGGSAGGATPVIAAVSK